MEPEITYDRTVEYHVLDAFGLELDAAGHIRHEDGGYVGSCCGKDSVRIDRVAGFADPPGERDIAVVCDTPRCILNSTIE